MKNKNENETNLNGYQFVACFANDGKYDLEHFAFSELVSLIEREGVKTELGDATEFDWIEKRAEYAIAAGQDVIGEDTYSLYVRLMK